MSEKADPSQTNNGPPTLRAMGFGELLDTTFSLYRTHFWLFLRIAAGYFIVMVIWVATLFFYDSAGRNTQIVLWVLGISAIFSVSVFVVSALIFASSQTYLDGKIRTVVVLRQATRQFFRCLVGSLFWGLLAILSIFFSIFSLTLLLLFSGSVDRDIMNMIVGISFLLALVCFTLLFISYLLFYISTVLMEGKSIRVGLWRSRELIRGKRWRVVGTVLSIFLLSIVIGIVLRVTFAFPLTFTGLEGLGDFFENVRWMVSWELPTNLSELHLSYVLMYLIKLGIDTFILPIWVIGSTLLYFDQRIRKEGFDIEVMAAR